MRHIGARRTLLTANTNSNIPTLSLNFAQGIYSAGTTIYANLASITGWTYSGGVLSGTGASGVYEQTAANGLQFFPATAGNSTGARVTTSGLWIWQASENYLIYSQALSNAAWTNVGVTAVENATDPVGGTTLDTLNEGTTSSSHESYQSVTVTSGATVSASIIIGAGTRRYVQLIVNNTSSNAFWITVDTTNFTITEHTSSGTGTLTSYGITQVGTNLYRIYITGAISSQTSYYITVSGATAASGNGNAASYVGTSSTIICGWAQFEVSSVVGPYMPTTSSAVSRTADYSRITLSTNPTSGTVYARTSLLGLGYVFQQTNGLSIFIRKTATNQFLSAFSGINLYNGFYPLTYSADRYGVAFSSSGRTITANGFTPSSDTNVVSYSGNTYSIGSQTTNTQLNGAIAVLILYPQVMSGTQLQTLTVSGP